VLGILVATGTLSTALLYAFATVESAVIVVVPTLLIGFLLYRSFTKRRGIRASPQFTRQNLREREEE